VPSDTGRNYLAAAMRLEPTNAASWQLRGMLNLRQQAYRDEPVDLRTAQEKEPGNFVTLLGLAQASFGLEDLTTCRQALQRILDTKGTLRDTLCPIDVPVTAYAQAQYALAVLDLREKRDARGDFERTLEEVKQYQQAYKDEAYAVEQYSGSNEKQLVEKLGSLAEGQLQPTIGPAVLTDPFPQP